MTEKTPELRPAKPLLRPRTGLRSALLRAVSLLAPVVSVLSAAPLGVGRRSPLARLGSRVSSPPPEEPVLGHRARLVRVHDSLAQAQTSMVLPATTEQPPPPSFEDPYLRRPPAPRRVSAPPLPRREAVAPKPAPVPVAREKVLLTPPPAPPPREEASPEPPPPVPPAPTPRKETSPKAPPPVPPRPRRAETSPPAPRPTPPPVPSRPQQSAPPPRDDRPEPPARTETAPSETAPTPSPRTPPPVPPRPRRPSSPPPVSPRPALRRADDPVPPGPRLAPSPSRLAPAPVLLGSAPPPEGPPEPPPLTDVQEFALKVQQGRELSDRLDALARRSRSSSAPPLPLGRSLDDGSLPSGSAPRPTPSLRAPVPLLVTPSVPALASTTPVPSSASPATTEATPTPYSGQKEPWTPPKKVGFAEQLAAARAESDRLERAAAGEQVQKGPLLPVPLVPTPSPLIAALDLATPILRPPSGPIGTPDTLTQVPSSLPTPRGKPLQVRDTDPHVLVPAPEPTPPSPPSETPEKPSSPWQRPRLLALARQGRTPKPVDPSGGGRDTSTQALDPSQAEAKERRERAEVLAKRAADAWWPTWMRTPTRPPEPETLVPRFERALEIVQLRRQPTRTPDQERRLRLLERAEAYDLADHGSNTLLDRILGRPSARVRALPPQGPRPVLVPEPSLLQPTKPELSAPDTSDQVREKVRIGAHRVGSHRLGSHLSGQGRPITVRSTDPQVVLSQPPERTTDDDEPDISFFRFNRGTAPVSNRFPRSVRDRLRKDRTVLAAWRKGTVDLDDIAEDPGLKLMLVEELREKERSESLSPEERALQRRLRALVTRKKKVDDDDDDTLVELFDDGTPESKELVRRAISLAERAADAYWPTWVRKLPEKEPPKEELVERFTRALRIVELRALPNRTPEQERKLQQLQRDEVRDRDRYGSNLHLDRLLGRPSLTPQQLESLPAPQGRPVAIHDDTPHVHLVSGGRAGDLWDDDAGPRTGRARAGSAPSRLRSSSLPPRVSVPSSGRSEGRGTEPPQGRARSVTLPDIRSGTSLPQNAPTPVKQEAEEETSVRARKKRPADRGALERLERQEALELLHELLLDDDLGTAVIQRALDLLEARRRLDRLREMR